MTEKHRGTPLVRIVIPARSETPSLRILLQDLREALAGETSETVTVFVSAQRNVIDCTDFILTGSMNSTLTASREVTGPSTGRNLAAAGADSEWLVFIDDDIRVTPAWWRGLKATLTAPGAADLIGGPVGSIRPRNWFSQAAEDFVIRHRKYPEGWYLVAANMAVRRQAFEQLGGFDAVNHDSGGEDWDLCRRAHRAGLRVAVSDAFPCAHANPTTWGDLSRRAKSYGRSAAVLAAQPPPSNPSPRPATSTGRAEPVRQPSTAMRVARWPIVEYRSLRSRGRSRFRSVRSIALYVPWMAMYLHSQQQATSERAMGQSPP